MDELLRNPWTISVVGGVVSTLIGGALLSLLQLGSQHSFEPEGCALVIFKAIFVGGAMFFLIWLSMFLFPVFATGMGHDMAFFMLCFLWFVAFMLFVFGAFFGGFN